MFKVLSLKVQSSDLRRISFKAAERAEFVICMPPFSAIFTGKYKFEIANFVLSF